MHVRVSGQVGRRGGGVLPWTIGITGVVALSAMATALDVRAGGMKTFYADDRIGSNQVCIFSEASLEDFTSVVNRVGGEARLDPKRIETFTGRFYFDLADLKTGLDIRDRAMLSEDWFDVARHPRVVLNWTKVEKLKKIGANTADLTLSGTCTLHGVTRNVQTPVTLAYLDESPQTLQKLKGDLIRMRGQFEIKMSDYGVKGPPGGHFVGIRVSDVQKVRFTIFGATTRPS